MSKNNQLKVLVVLSILPALLVSNEMVSLLSLVIEAQCWEQQQFEFPRLVNVIVFVIVLFWAQIVMVQPFLIAFKSLL
jgi:hypothetical protein